MISNINYKAKASVEAISHLDYGIKKPQQYIQKCPKYKIIIFRSGNCRVMGCKKPLHDNEKFPFGIKIQRIQSITISENIGSVVNLYKMARSMKHECLFEPELFTALRFTKYNPLCINVFATGKVMILGIKDLDYKKQIMKIMSDIRTHIINQ
jgi:TATA-box binding protein (TBP) (component of TFIID and TFIIIB)